MARITICLEDYLRFGRNLPVVRFTDRYNAMPTVALAIDQRAGPPVRMKIFMPAPAPDWPPDGGITPSQRDVEAPRQIFTGELADATEALPARTCAGDVRHAQQPPEEPHLAPTLSFYGKRSGLRLRQDGRWNGARDGARPA